VGLFCLKEPPTLANSGDSRSSAEQPVYATDLAGTTDSERSDGTPRTGEQARRDVEGRIAVSRTQATRKSADAARVHVAETTGGAPSSGLCTTPSNVLVQPDSARRDREFDRSAHRTFECSFQVVASCHLLHEAYALTRTVGLSGAPNRHRLANRTC